MYDPKELEGLHQFLRNTAEGNLRKMMVSGRMTEVHLRILLKVARAGSASEFVGWVNSEGFPKMKMSEAEHGVRETFWPVALAACAGLGLIGNQKAA